MTTAGGIIIWTLMLLVLVVSQHTTLEGGKGAVCNVTNETQTDPVWNCRKCENPTYRDHYLCRGEPCMLTRKNSTTSWYKQKCCDGYKVENSICKPQCSPKCEEGYYCAKPNECECNHGWSGQNCTESLWCVVDVNLTPMISNLPPKVPYYHTSKKWEMPDCLPKCRDQVSNISVLVARSTNVMRHFVPIESPCNIEDDVTSGNLFERYKYSLAGILGIIICAIVAFCVTCFFKKKRRATCDEEDIPMETGSTKDYMVENMIYS